MSTTKEKKRKQNYKPKNNKILHRTSIHKKSPNKALSGLCPNLPEDVSA
jgi:hypothetical protein